jgi:DNA mismatch endonuclease (patch repair protein)
MTDTVSKKKRSEIMSKVKSKDSKIEVDFRKAIWKAGFRYRKNSTKYFGKPDMVLPKHKTAIFIDSCFWHGCERHCRLPAARKKYWTTKIERNKERDKEVNRHYKKIGWRVIRVWEHKILDNTQEIVEKVLNLI